jgi:hypothetical protein
MQDRYLDIKADKQEIFKAFQRAGFTLKGEPSNSASYLEVDLFTQTYRLISRPSGSWKVVDMKGFYKAYEDYVSNERPAIIVESNEPALLKHVRDKNLIGVKNQQTTEDISKRSKHLFYLNMKYAEEGQTTFAVMTDGCPDTLKEVLKDNLPWLDNRNIAFRFSKLNELYNFEGKEIQIYLFFRKGQLKETEEGEIIKFLIKFFEDINLRDFLEVATSANSFTSGNFKKFLTWKRFFYKDIQSGNVYFVKTPVYYDFDYFKIKPNHYIRAFLVFKNEVDKASVYGFFMSTALDYDDTNHHSIVISCQDKKHSQTRVFYDYVYKLNPSWFVGFGYDMLDKDMEAFQTKFATVCKDDKVWLSLPVYPKEDLDFEDGEVIETEEGYFLLLEDRSRRYVIPFTSKAVKESLEYRLDDYYAYLDAASAKPWTKAQGIVFKKLKAAEKLSLKSRFFFDTLKDNLPLGSLVASGNHVFIVCEKAIKDSYVLLATHIKKDSVLEGKVTSVSPAKSKGKLIKDTRPLKDISYLCDIHFNLNKKPAKPKEEDPNSQKRMTSLFGFIAKAKPKKAAKFYPKKHPKEKEKEKAGKD